MPTGAPLTGRKTSQLQTLLFRVAFTVEASPQRYERVTDPSLYVGAETDKTCHEDIFKGFETTPRFVTTVENKRGPEWQGCEACCGAGKEQVEGGGDNTRIFTFTGVSAAASNARWKKGER